MKEPRKGAIGRATGIAEGVAAAMRRRQRLREPRVLVYDQLGHSRLLAFEGPHRDRILDVCDELVELTIPRASGAAEEEGPGE